MKVTEVAEAVGIENMAHFYELFRRYTGCKAKEYTAKLEADPYNPLIKVQE
ncbi:helix-turn-helix domain-containing protein [Paenibacillus thiaminolyticus]|uniref:helix-turn-helix domain-containing protein n=1 Tax=Paenibacillus thiaminolyticus TaxID=49283 RepID=UPI002175CA6D|nr:helix-turn-helix domain-containing protein [Paenibacillus thiaminolyticus]